MGINLKANLSSDDIDRAKNIRNPPAQDAGDNMSGGTGGFDDLFGSDDSWSFDDDDLFGGGGSSGNNGGDPFSSNNNTSFGGNNNNNNLGGNNFGGNGTFGGNNPGGAFGGGFTGFNQQNTQQPVVQQKDNWDRAFDFSAEGLTNIGKVMVELIKSIRNRTADDIGYYSNNLIKTGLIGIAVAFVISLLAILTKVKFLSISGLSGTFLLAFALTAGGGMIGLGLAAYFIAGTTRDSMPDIKSLPDVGSQFPDDATDDYEDELGDIMADLFGDEDEDSDSLFGESESSEFGAPESNTPYIPEFTNTTPEVVDFEKELEAVRANKLINRKTLLEEFLRFLPLNNPEFAVKKDIDPDSDDFTYLEAKCLKAMANVMKCEPEEVKSSLTSAKETFFSYELRMKRVRGLTKTAELASEIEIYLKENPSDVGISATIDIIGDDYYIVITKGVTAVVTMGDCFKQKYVMDFFENEKNQLPIISGITELGEVIVNDAKLFDTMLIAGKPRSGKSWYVLSILASLMLFNTPEDVQFIIVDPKESNLFKTLAYMPHVAGLHNDDQILQIMDDIISNEAPRRKQLLADHRCDDIWAIRKKGIKLPILYLVIDEYITVRTNLKELSKELDTKLQVMISQLPSLGIRLLFVPHRATGIVDKTNRTMLQFTACVKSDTDEITDTLSIKSWKRPLTNPGDIAYKSSSNPNAQFVRGAAVTTGDDTNAELIETIAKAFYKMGVDLPDMSSMEVAVNRDEDKIRSLLGGQNRIQYDANTIFKDEDSEDWSF